MGKKIVLSEAQFKNYMRRLLKEDTAGTNASTEYKLLAQKMQRYASYIESMGQAYINAYDIILSTIKNYGAQVTGVSEFNSDGLPSMTVGVDISGVTPYGNGSEDYGSPEEWFADMVQNDMEYDVVRGTSLNKKFDGLECHYENGSVIVKLIPHQWLSPMEIRNFLPDI